MEFLKTYYLFFVIIGLFFLSVSLHFKKENKELKYGFFGWAENLTIKGKIYFVLGILLAFLGAIAEMTD